MSVNVLGHIHEPPLRLPQGPSSELIIKTGTIVTEFGLTEGTEVIEKAKTPQGEDLIDPDSWHRDQLRMQVLDLSEFKFLPRVRFVGIATASPASIEYLPPEVRFGEFVPDWIAEGAIQVFNQGNTELFRGTARLGVTARGDGRNGSSYLAKPAGWAVDETVLEFHNWNALLVANLAARKSSALWRIAYTLFVTVLNKTTIDAHP